MRVLVNGGGNIGTTVACLLAKYKTELGVSAIYLKKQTDFPWREADNDHLSKLGVKLLVGVQEPRDYNHFLQGIEYIFEATQNGQGLKNLEHYKLIEGMQASAQGSEKGFGVPFMSGLNNSKVAKEPFVQVVSCNTHGAASILQTLGGDGFSNIKSADFVVVRRSEDLGNHQRLVAANVIARHLDDTIGTHHAIDVNDMLQTIGVNFPISSSDITTPSQLMHSTRFTIELKKAVTKTEFINLIDANKMLSRTNKFDSNLVFELGRRYGFHGRIFSHAIVVTNNLLIKDNVVKGWAFVPQEGNSILSTLHAFLLQMNVDDGEDIFNKIKKEILVDKW